MKCQILFSGKNKKNISKCRLLKILPRVLSVNYICLSFPLCWGLDVYLILSVPEFNYLLSL